MLASVLAQMSVIEKAPMMVNLKEPESNCKIDAKYNLTTKT